MTEEEKICYFDIRKTLRDNYSKIDDLKNYSIEKFYIDALGNQWFLYKPKSNNSQGQKQLWVRLRNFPYAFPFEINTASLNQYWPSLSGSSIQNSLTNVSDFKISGSFGYIRFSLIESGEVILFFTIGNYNLTEETIKDSFNQDIEVKGETKFLKKTISIEVLSIFKLVGPYNYFDIIPYGENFYIFYYNTQTIKTSKEIYFKRISQEIGYLTPDMSLTDENKTSSILLPDYSANTGNNVAIPLENPQFKISISEDKINLAYLAENYLSAGEGAYINNNYQ